MSSQNLENLSIQELKKLVKNENKKEKEKQGLLSAYKKLQNKKEKQRLLEIISDYYYFTFLDEVENEVDYYYEDKPIIHYI